jgi:hypothetical protein
MIKYKLKQELKKQFILVGLVLEFALNKCRLENISLSVEQTYVSNQYHITN